MLGVIFGIVITLVALYILIIPIYWVYTLERLTKYKKNESPGNIMAENTIKSIFWLISEFDYRIYEHYEPKIREWKKSS